MPDADGCRTVLNVDSEHAAQRALRRVRLAGELAQTSSSLSVAKKLSATRHPGMQLTDCVTSRQRRRDAAGSRQQLG